MKLSYRGVIALLFGGILATAATTAQAADYVLNVNTALAEDDPIYDGLERLASNVAEASGGKLEIRIFPGSQLGSDEDLLEQARAGANVAVLVDGARLAPYTREFGILVLQPRFSGRSWTLCRYQMEGADDDNQR